MEPDDPVAGADDEPDDGGDPVPPVDPEDPGEPAAPAPEAPVAPDVEPPEPEAGIEEAWLDCHCVYSALLSRWFLSLSNLAKSAAVSFVSSVLSSFIDTDPLLSLSIDANVLLVIAFDWSWCDVPSVVWPCWPDPVAPLPGGCCARAGAPSVAVKAAAARINRMVISAFLFFAARSVHRRETGWLTPRSVRCARHDERVL